MGWDLGGVGYKYVIVRVYIQINVMQTYSSYVYYIIHGHPHGVLAVWTSPISQTTTWRNLWCRASVMTGLLGDHGWG